MERQGVESETDRQMDSRGDAGKCGVRAGGVAPEEGSGVEAGTPGGDAGNQPPPGTPGVFLSLPGCSDHPTLPPLPALVQGGEG